MKDAQNNGQAIIEDGAIVIRVPLGTLGAVIDGAWAAGHYNPRLKITDAAVFAKELVRELNREDEAGTTEIHRVFDRCIYAACDQGAEGIDVHEEQNA